MRVLETPRLLLRTDAEPIARAELNAAYRIYVEELEGETLSLDDFEREVLFDLYLAHNGLGQYFGRPTIVIKETSRRIGHCVFLPRLCTLAERAAVISPPDAVRGSSIEAEIGWAISARYRNLGYATEAAQALVTYGFDELSLARLVAFTEQDNYASLKVMRKLGMRIGRYGDADEMVGVIENTAS